MGGFVWRTSCFVYRFTPDKLLQGIAIMREIIMPFRIEDLIVRPEFAGRVQLSDDMQQTLASLVGYDGIGRRLLHSSKGGVLYQTTPRLGNIIHTVGVGTPRRYVGPDLSITEVMVMGHPDNGELLWVKNDEIATAANGWPLAGGFCATETMVLLICIKNSYSEPGLLPPPERRAGRLLILTFLMQALITMMYPPPLRWIRVLSMTRGIQMLTTTV